MISLTREFVKNNISDSIVIFERGLRIFKLGSYNLKEGI
ncbi:hypothetical protein ASN18_1042 [Candidatus Magnetominusculus xianensis]|uniref:Uncharacterized protein n=1 Tax=Candidatus Magnetominusculus xianensis TaxID=1748249 RepID=A0ABR5SI77_9BACT|nr:hypothetical protein ASN18_1042 [Candidatus Magnetominusculus xianensis]